MSANYGTIPTNLSIGASQSVRRNAADNAFEAYTPATTQPVFFPQYVMSSSPTSTINNEIGAFAAETDGSAFYIAVPFSGSSVYLMYRYQKDDGGQYFYTNSATGSATTSPAVSSSGLVVLGSYLYHFYRSGSNVACDRYDKANLANKTAMTIPTITWGYPTNVFTDGTNIAVQSSGGGTWYRLSVSGTTLSTVTTYTVNAAYRNDYTTFLYDGTSQLYSLEMTANTVGTAPTISKFSDTTGTNAPTSTSTPNLFTPFATTEVMKGVINIDSTRMYVLTQTSNEQAGTVYYAYWLIPYLKP